jgi:methionyl-tRNA formyltransferase
MKQYAACVGAPWGYRALDRVAHLNVTAIHEEVALTFKPRPRYLFFLNWSRVVPPAVVDAIECVNFHCTPLPYGRGGHPIENMLLRGHAETVITAHRMTAEIDAGPIYGIQGSVSLAGTKEEILARFVEPVADLMRWIVETEPAPTPQVGKVVEFQRLTSEAYRQFWEARR